MNEPLTFIPPAPTPIKWTDTNLDPTYWHIDVGTFYDRLGSAKLPILASTDTTVQAIVKDTQIRLFIDLKRQDVADSLTYVSSKVPALTAAMIVTIITTPTTEYERHIKGMVQPL
jgi:hypothetical protein